MERVKLKPRALCVYEGLRSVLEARKPKAQRPPPVELRCQCGRILTDANPCPIPGGKRCENL